MTTQITITHVAKFVSKDIGFSAWVHVCNNTDDDFAYHVGYYKGVYEAKAMAKNAAKGIQKTMKMCGKKPKMTEGDAT